MSIASNGDPSDGYSQAATVSDDGRYVAFQSMAKDLTPAVDAPNDIDVFRRDRTQAYTELVSANSNGQPGNKGGAGPQISGDGSLVAFFSGSSNLVAGDTNGVSDVFLRDMTWGLTSRSSVTTPGGQLNGLSFDPSISPDGYGVGYATLSTNGFNHDTNSTFDVYVRGVQEIGPFGGTIGIVQHAGQDFDGGLPSASAAAAADASIRYGIASPSSYINSRAHGPFDDHRAPVMRLYWAFFKRVPDLAGLNYWSGKHAKGMSMKDIANGFAKSSEFQNNFGGGTDTQFVTLVYTNVLERQPDQAGLDHWVNKMKAGTTRGEMMINFSESSEGIRKMRGEVDTELVVLGMLHRVPTKGEVISYANALELNGGQPTEVLILNLLTSAEFASHVN